MRIGELFAGYGGLGMAARAAYGGEVVWWSEIDPAPAAIMARHHPDVPNLGDITAIDWDDVPRVDILTGGFPCQDVSVAGRRAGMTAGTRSGLWAYMARAIDLLRPRLVVIENVVGLFNAGAGSVVVPHPVCLGADGSGSETVLLRGMGTVLGELSTFGYDAQWTVVRASDVGAPHRRERVFITAHPAGDTRRFPLGDGGSAGHSGGDGGGGRSCLSEPGAAGGADSPTDRADSRSGAPGGAAAVTDWGIYRPAIERWERTLGRPAPAPMEPGRARPRLSARFVEWMMGLPDGWVTGTPGLTRTQQLRALGNGVVPLQAQAALEHLATVARMGAAA